MKSSTKLEPFKIRSRKSQTLINTKEDLLKILPKFHKINQSLVEFINKIDFGDSVTTTQFETHIQKYQTERSNFKIPFWTRRGYTEQEAKDKISIIQSKNAKKVKPKQRHQIALCKEYWIKKGFTEEESKMKVKEMIGECSNLKEQFWLKRGSLKKNLKLKSQKFKRTILKSSGQIPRKLN